jgi:hypothetical protein
MSLYIKEQHVSITMEKKAIQYAVIMKAGNKEYDSNKHFYNSSLEIKTIFL